MPHTIGCAQCVKELEKNLISKLPFWLLFVGVFLIVGGVLSYDLTHLKDDVERQVTGFSKHYPVASIFGAIACFGGAVLAHWYNQRRHWKQIVSPIHLDSARFRPVFAEHQALPQDKVGELEQLVAKLPVQGKILAITGGGSSQKSTFLVHALRRLSSRTLILQPSNYDLDALVLPWDIRWKLHRQSDLIPVLAIDDLDQVNVQQLQAGLRQLASAIARPCLLIGSYKRTPETQDEFATWCAKLGRDRVVEFRVETQERLDRQAFSQLSGSQQQVLRLAFLLEEAGACLDEAAYVRVEGSAHSGDNALGGLRSEGWLERKPNSELVPTPKARRAHNEVPPLLTQPQQIRLVKELVRTGSSEVLCRLGVVWGGHADELGVTLAFDQALTLKPRDPFLRLQYGQTLLGLSRREESDLNQTQLLDRARQQFVAGLGFSTRSQAPVCRIALLEVLLLQVGLSDGATGSREALGREIEDHLRLLERAAPWRDSAKVYRTALATLTSMDGANRLSQAREGDLLGFEIELARARHDLHLGAFQEAESRLKRLPSRPGHDQSVSYLLAVLYGKWARSLSDNSQREVALDKCAQALRLLERILQDNPRDTRALLTSARVFLQTAELMPNFHMTAETQRQRAAALHHAEVLLLQAVEISPGDPEQHHLLGLINARKFEFDRPNYSFETTNRHLQQAYDLLCLARSSTPRFRALLETWCRVRCMEAMRLEDPAVGQAERARRLRADAIRDFQWLCRQVSAPEDKLINALAIALEKQGNLDEARALYEKHRERLPQSAVLSMSFLRLLAAQRNFQADWRQLTDYYHAHAGLFAGSSNHRRLLDFSRDLWDWTRERILAADLTTAQTILDFAATVANRIGDTAAVQSAQAFLAQHARNGRSLPTE